MFAWWSALHNLDAYLRVPCSVCINVAMTYVLFRVEAWCRDCARTEQKSVNDVAEHPIGAREGPVADCTWGADEFDKDLL